MLTIHRHQMKVSLNQLGLVAFFVLFLIQTIRLEFVSPEPSPEPVPPDTVRITQIDTLTLPADTVWQEVVINKPKPAGQKPAPEPVPPVISTYSDSVKIGDCLVAYDAEVLGELRKIKLKARRATSKVIRITSTEYVRQEVIKKTYPTRFYIGGGIGASKGPRVELAASAILATKKNAYSLDYDFINQSVRAKAYIKIF